MANGRTLSYYRCCNIHINKDLSVKVTTKNSEINFNDYTSYRSEVDGILRRLFTNAESPFRKIKYGTISTISRGYDAVASSVLAYNAGCRTVITFSSPAKYAADNGTELAKTIGYTDIREYDADKYLRQTELIEAECMSSGDVGSAIVFAAYKQDFHNKMVFMGIRGDSLWERNHANVNDNQDFTNGNTFQQTDHIFTETCLDVNAVCIPVPMIGSDRWSLLANLSQSKEMKQWAIRNKYDRPIARRIAEDVGIERNSFGCIKAGAGISYHFDTMNTMARKMSPYSFKSLKEFKKQYKPNKIKIIRHKIQFLKSELPVYINYILSKLGIKCRIKRNNNFISSPISSLLIQWSLHCMKSKYQSS